MNQIIQHISGWTSWIALLAALWCLYRAVQFHKFAVGYHQQAQALCDKASDRYREATLMRETVRERERTLDLAEELDERYEARLSELRKLTRYRCSVRHPKKREVKVLRKPPKALPKHIASRAKLKPVLYGRVMEGA